MKYLLLFLFVTTLLFSNDSISLEDDFLKSLDEVSEIATKSKLNIDDTPSFVTVLQSDRLKKLGVKNVFEALGLVPGVELTREASGVPVVVFRGVSQKGEVKLMVDGVTINNSYRGSIYYYLDFPIEIVKRIEVIRGAGSILYGSGAISGVVNIITKTSDKDSQNSIFMTGGTYDSLSGGALVSTNVGEMRIATDVYYQKDNKYVDSSDKHLKDYGVGLNLNYKDFTLTSRIKKSDIGNAYGVLGVTDTAKDKYNNENTSIFTQLTYTHKLNNDNKISVLAGYETYAQKVATKHSALGDIDSDYKEDSYFTQVDLASSFFEDNELLIGTKFESADTIKSTMTVISPVSKPGLKRDTTSVYINDIYSASSELDISAGVRYDDYSDLGSSFSPNLGLVYRISEQVKLKALYSHAFRAPSWVELTSNSTLKAEKSDSIETGLVYKQNQNNIFRVNFYAIKINDMITKPAGTYVQNSENKFYGTEVEYLSSLNNKTDLNFIASYVKAKDSNGNTLQNIANILASTSLIYQTSSGITFGSLLKYTHSSYTANADIKDNIIFDETISYEFENFTSSLSIKDLFDRNTYYALPSSTTKYDDGGRSVMIKVSMDF